MNSINHESLIGTWISDPQDIESLQRFGNISLQFKEDGRLIYTVHEIERDRIILLTYRVEGATILTDQPSAAHEERTGFSLSEDRLTLHHKNSVQYLLRER